MKRSKSKKKHGKKWHSPVSSDVERVLRGGGAFSNGIGMLTSGWRSASSLVISRWEEVTVPISYKRFSANCLHYVQLSARMKEDVFSTRDWLETEKGEGWIFMVP